MDEVRKWVEICKRDAERLSTRCVDTRLRCDDCMLKTGAVDGTWSTCASIHLNELLQAIEKANILDTPSVTAPTLEMEEKESEQDSGTIIYTVIVPRPNLSASLQQQFENKLVEAFGGFSAYNGTGGWKDNNNDLHFDTHIRYEIQANEDKWTQNTWKLLVTWIKDVTLQQEMYTTAVREGTL